MIEYDIEAYKRQNQYDPALITTDTHTTAIMPVAAYVPAKSYTDVYGGGLVPFEFTGWRDETLAWHLTCSLHATLNPSPTVIIRGPQAIDFMRENFVNNVDNWPIGASKHGLMLLEDGTVASQGVIIRLDEQEYEAFWLSPFLEYRFSLKDWDAELEDITDRRTLFQLQGPETLRILEEATGTNLHDIGFCRSKEAEISGMPVRILRFGMGNSLGYEVHCDSCDSPKIHKILLEIGAPHGIRQMGSNAYEMNHTTGGSQQAGTHFMCSTFEDPNYVEFFRKTMGEGDVSLDNEGFIMAGSMGPDISLRYANPIELDLGRVVNYNHDFIGKEALLEYKKAPKRGLKTLVWNADDVADIYRSQFTDDPYRPMDEWTRENGPFGLPVIPNDQILDMEGNVIGMSGGRMMDWYNRAMLSLGIMDIAFCEDGTEVQVVWGEPGTHQKRIRATVAPCPYNTHLENRSADVSQY